MSDSQKNVQLTPSTSKTADEGTLEGGGAITPSPPDLSPNSAEYGGINWTPYIPDPLSIKDTVPQPQTNDSTALKTVKIIVDTVFNVFNRPENLDAAIIAVEDVSDIYPSSSTAVPARVTQRRDHTSEPSSPASPNPADKGDRIEVNLEEAAKAETKASMGAKTESKDESESPPKRAKKVDLQVEPSISKPPEKLHEKGTLCALDIIPEEVSLLASGGPSGMSLVQGDVTLPMKGIGTRNAPGDEEAALPGRGNGGNSRNKQSILCRFRDCVGDVTSRAVGGNSSAGPNESTPLLPSSASGMTIPDIPEVSNVQEVMKTIYNLLPSNRAVQAVAKGTSLLGGGAGVVCAGIYASGQPVGPTLHSWWKKAVYWISRVGAGTGDHDDDDSHDEGNGTTTTALPTFGWMDNLFVPNESTNAIVHLSRNGHDYFYPY